MEIKDFIEETQNIEQYYGKELDKFQRDIWYRELGKINIERYRQITRQVYRQCKFMPKLADILEIQKELPYMQKQEPNTVKVECKKCNSKGFILYNKNVKNGEGKIIYECFARCDCDNGKRYAYDGTKVSNAEHRSKFYVATMSQLGF